MTIGIIIGAIDDHGTIRDNLKVVKKGNIFIVVDTGRITALCHDEPCGLVTMNTPVTWEDSVAAAEWVSSGSVKGLQRALGYPNVGFRTCQFVLSGKRRLDDPLLDKTHPSGLPESSAPGPITDEEEPKKEFVVVEKLLDEHREVKNKIFIWLNYGVLSDGIYVQCYFEGITTTLATILEEGIRLSKYASYSGIAVESDSYQKIKLIT